MRSRRRKKLLAKRTRTILFRMVFVVFVLIVGYSELQTTPPPASESSQPVIVSSPAGQVLGSLLVKGRAPKTGYSRAVFSSGWEGNSTCDVRNQVLGRDLTNTTTLPDTCKITSGILNDPYTGSTIAFERGPNSSAKIQIDHVVSLSDAWQKGAQSLTPAMRRALANDLLNLLAVDGTANQQKSDGDAATWLPKNKDYRCSYVARQIAVKHKYSLWVTPAEQKAMASILETCPEQAIPTK